MGILVGVLSFISGTFFGVVIMCLMQIAGVMKSERINAFKFV